MVRLDAIIRVRNRYKQTLETDVLQYKVQLDIIFHMNLYKPCEMLHHGWALLAGAFAASAVYQVIVYEYTAGDRVPPYNDWHRFLLLGATVTATVIAIYHAGQLLMTGRNKDAVVVLVSASPAFILLSYLAQTQMALQQGYAKDWRREVVHAYSGLCLAIMFVTVVWCVPHLVYTKLKATA